ncbi:hypothetical protein F2Q69_00032426 [Brassica cretica]|uniref:Uncharacterized protein n=1 Tax=Brassica cretica TaxID=69181 RepID=A0A8S9S7M7_BRACR|nr:hypothetical protein F2Q69_00032426 [Brassica cretica]
MSRRGEPPRDQKRRGRVVEEIHRKIKSAEAESSRSRRGELERRGAVEERKRDAEPSRRGRETQSRRGEPPRDQNHTCRVVDEPSRIATEISKAERRSRRGEMERCGAVEEIWRDEQSTDGDAEESHRSKHMQSRRGKLERQSVVEERERDETPNDFFSRKNEKNAQRTRVPQDPALYGS